MLVAGIAAVEHRGFDRLSLRKTVPRLRVAEVAPGIKRQFLLHVAFGIGDGGPAAEVVFEDVVAICEACGQACVVLMVQS